MNQLELQLSSVADHRAPLLYYTKIDDGNIHTDGQRIRNTLHDNNHPARNVQVLSLPYLPSPLQVLITFSPSPSLGSPRRPNPYLDTPCPPDPNFSFRSPTRSKFPNPVLGCAQGLPPASLDLTGLQPAPLELRLTTSSRWESALSSCDLSD